MSARDGSRTAALPPAGYQPKPRMNPDGAAVVRFVPENPDSPPRDFDFANLPVSPALRLALAQGFAARTRPGGSVRARSSAEQAFHHLRGFATYLGGLNRPPQTAAALAPAHLEGWLLQRQDHAAVSTELADLKASLRRIPGISSEFAACLAERNPPRVKSGRPATAGWSSPGFSMPLAATSVKLLSGSVPTGCCCCGGVLAISRANHVRCGGAGSCWTSSTGTVMFPAITGGSFLPWTGYAASARSSSMSPRCTCHCGRPPRSSCCWSG